MLTNVKANIAYKAKMELRNAPMFSSTELLSVELVAETVAKAS